MSSDIVFPQSPFVDSKTLNLSREWQLWLLNPSFLTVKFSEALGVSYGGLGQPTNPLTDYVLVGTGTAYEAREFLPIAAFPGLTGDVNVDPGSTTATLEVVNGNPGTYGDGFHTSVVTVDSKGRSTAVTNANIAGSPGGFAVAGALTATTATIAGATKVGTFGCNGAGPQNSVSSGGAVAATGATNVTPFGFTTAAQANQIVSLLNTIRAALVANGIMT